MDGRPVAKRTRQQRSQSFEQWAEGLAQTSTPKNRRSPKRVVDFQNVQVVDLVGEDHEDDDEEEEEEEEQLVPKKRGGGSRGRGGSRVHGRSGSCGRSSNSECGSSSGRGSCGSGRSRGRRSRGRTTSVASPNREHDNNLNMPSEPEEKRNRGDRVKPSENLERPTEAEEPGIDDDDDNDEPVIDVDELSSDNDDDDDDDDGGVTFIGEGGNPCVSDEEEEERGTTAGDTSEPVVLDGSQNQQVGSQNQQRTYEPDVVDESQNQRRAYEPDVVDESQNQRRAYEPDVVDESQSQQRIPEPVVVDESQSQLRIPEPVVVDESKSLQKSCVAKRTRSHFKSNAFRFKHGTFSKPFCVDSDADEDEEGEDDGINDDVNAAADDDDDFDANAGHGDTEPRAAPERAQDVMTILADSILEDDVIEGLLSSPNDKYRGETSVPLKFKFRVEESSPPPDDDEDELDPLWAEFRFCLESCAIESTSSSEASVGDEHAATLNMKTGRPFCKEGNHDFSFDEEIGKTCLKCGYVVEIRNILPPFAEDPWKKPSKQGFEGQSQFDGLSFQDSGNDSPVKCVPAVQATGTVWDIIPNARCTMYRHQQDGFEFIWNNVVGGINLDQLKDPSNCRGGSGCIISHAPGTGKTRLAIVFLQAYLELFPASRPVIIAPRSMLLTWEEEFRKWNVGIPFHNLYKSEFSGKESKTALDIIRPVKSLSTNKTIVRMVKLYSWKSERSILGISYRLFEKLAGKKVDDERRSGRSIEAKQIRKILLELPGLVVLDEGHTPRNNQSLIWKAASKIKTKKRIMLSGTPFQNNFDELYNTLCLVRPKSADRFKQYKDVGNKERETCSSGRGRWTCFNKVEELKKIIDPFVHVHKGSILQENLPGLRDMVVVLQPTELQDRLIGNMNKLGRCSIEQQYLVSLISVHPSLLPASVISKEDQLMLGNMKNNPIVGVKTKFLMELIRLSQALNEKILIFSQYIGPLTFIMEQLRFHYGWNEKEEILLMDGKLEVGQRQNSISKFNKPESNARVLLASTKACSEGINLVGASRVVLLDVVWNPSVERQAISRAYRLGQQRMVYVYHLIMSGTIEGKKYCRQVEKDRMSELMFSSSDSDQNCYMHEVPSTVSEDKILDEMRHHEKLRGIFEKIIFQPKESSLVETFGL